MLFLIYLKWDIAFLHLRAELFNLWKMRYQRENRYVSKFYVIIDSIELMVKDVKSIPVICYKELATKPVWKFVKVDHDLMTYSPNFKENELPEGSYFWNS